MTPSQRVEWHQNCLALTTALWIPLLGPQSDAYASQADELFYGGAAGGSKSELLLGLAITAQLDSIVFRRTFTQLAGTTGLIAKSTAILSGLARWNGQEHAWRDIPGGRSLEFGATKEAKKWEDYMGRPHDFIGFDEVPQFPESVYRALVGWNRTDVEGQRCRVVATGNPPTREEQRWVIRYWGPWLDDSHPNPAQPGELRWFVPAPGGTGDIEVDGPGPVRQGGEEYRPKSRTFIPARLADNPYYLVTDYERTLQGLPEPLRSQLLWGDFTAAMTDDPWQVIPTEHIKLAQGRWTPEPPRQSNGLLVPLTAVGIDPVRGGADKLTVVGRRDNWYTPIAKHAGVICKDGPAVAARVVEFLREHGGTKETPLHIDIIGIGSSAYDTLAGWGYNVVAINFGAATKARDRAGLLGMKNVRAEAYWGTREALHPETGDNLLLPDDAELRGDLTAPTWTPTNEGVLLEPKEKIKTRIGRSPDCGDAVVMCGLSRVITGDIGH